MSMPVTSAPSCAIGRAVVPSPQPRSSTLSGGLTPTDCTSFSPDSRMVDAIAVKSPFSHNAWFGFGFVLTTAPWRAFESGEARSLRLFVIAPQMAESRMFPEHLLVDPAIDDAAPEAPLLSQLGRRD